MPYGQSVLEKELTRRNGAKIKVPWRLLLIAFLTFSATVAIFLGLKFGYLPYLNSRIEKVNREINQLTVSISEEDVQNFFGLYSRLVNIDNLLNNRYRSTKALELLEKNTIKSVFYTDFHYDFKDKTFTLEGRALNYETLSQQLEIFKKLPAVKNLKLESAYSEGGKNIPPRFVIRMELNI